MGRDIFWRSFVEEGFTKLEGATDWWDKVNESQRWQDGIFYTLCAAYALVAVVALYFIGNTSSRMQEVTMQPAKYDLINGLERLKQPWRCSRPLMRVAWLLSDMHGWVYMIGCAKGSRNSQTIELERAMENTRSRINHDCTGVAGYGLV
eukprot:Gb_37587 [translate_table: standard]